MVLSNCAILDLSQQKLYAQTIRKIWHMQKKVSKKVQHNCADIYSDIQKHTTLQYRAPEMIDLYQHKLISEKVDIWVCLNCIIHDLTLNQALGCVLYKLAFYVTPFEDCNPLQILNVKYTIPATSPYSANLHNLISMYQLVSPLLLLILKLEFMLNADPDKRPDISDVIEEICKLRNIASPPRVLLLVCVYTINFKCSQNPNFCHLKLYKLHIQLTQSKQRHLIAPHIAPI